MKLLNPCLSGVLNWGVQKNNLVLYSNLVNNGLQRQMTIQKLLKNRNQHVDEEAIAPYLVIFVLFIASSLIRNISQHSLSSSITIVGTAEFGAK